MKLQNYLAAQMIVHTIIIPALENERRAEIDKGRLPYYLCVECFSQISFDSEVYTNSAAVADSEVYTKSATAADFVYTSESNGSCERHSTQR